MGEGCQGDIKSQNIFMMAAGDAKIGLGSACDFGSAADPRAKWVVSSPKVGASTGAMGFR